MSAASIGGRNRSSSILVMRSHLPRLLERTSVQNWECWGYGDRAYCILPERYARGEITKDQNDQMTRDLQQHNQPV